MTRIDLHDHYPHEPQGSFIEVSDEVFAALRGFEREDIARQVKEFRYKAYFSLDALDGIEKSALIKPETPQEAFERKYDNELLYTAISNLPEKQAQRVYARYILGKSVCEIARLEGLHHSSVAESINRALAVMEKFFEEN